MPNYKPLEITEYDDGGFDIFIEDENYRSVGIFKDGKIIWDFIGGENHASPEDAETFALALLMAARKSREITSK